MTTFHSVSPEVLRRALELHGFIVVQEDEYNWGMTKLDDSKPIIVPKKARLVPLDVISAIRGEAKLDNNTYLTLILKASEQLGVSYPTS